MTGAFSRVQEKAILGSTILASAMAFIDFTALNVAFPALQKDLNIGGAELLWIANGYALFLSSLMLVGGALGDSLGRKKVFMSGIILFTLASVLCGFSTGPEMLIASRCLQGVGGAMMVPGSLSIISASFPKESRGKAIGTWSMFASITTILGPALGGWFAGMGLWRLIFFINIPLALTSLFLLVRYVPESKDPNVSKLDYLGSFLITLSLAGLTYGFIEAPEKGFLDWRIISSLSVGIITMAGFLFIEGSSKNAMMPLSLFRSRVFSGANFMTLLVYGALGGFLFFFPLNLIQVQGYPPEIAGFTMLPFGLLIAFLARVSGAWADRSGPRKPLVLGTALVAVGFYLFSIPELTRGPSDYWLSFFPAILVAGTGMGLVIAPLTTSVMNAVPSEKTGIASGVNNSISRTAGVLAVAVIGAMVLFSFDSEIRSYLDTLDLRPEVYEATVAEIPKLAEARPPEFCNEEERNGIIHAIKMAFIHAFDRSAKIASLLALGGSIIAFFFLKEDKRGIR